MFLGDLSFFLYEEIEQTFMCGFNVTARNIFMLLHFSVEHELHCPNVGGVLKTFSPFLSEWPETYELKAQKQQTVNLSLIYIFLEATTGELFILYYTRLFNFDLAS